MLYNAYDLQRSWLAGASMMANLGSEWLQSPANPLSHVAMGPLVASGLDVFAHAAAARGKPAFGFTQTTVDGREVAVSEEIVLRKPRRRGDEVVVIRLLGPAAAGPVPPPPPPIIPPGAPRSDDGRWWWDGARWNPC